MKRLIKQATKLQSAKMLAAVSFLVVPVANVIAGDTAYDGQCAMGMAVGNPVPTDCSIVWDDEDGSRFCFASEQSKSQFLENSAFNKIKADEYYSLGETQKLAKKMQYIQSSDVKDFLNNQIEKKTDPETGDYLLYDPLHKKHQPVRFIEIQMMRTLHGYGFFPNVVYASASDESAKYWVDYWIRPSGERDLELAEERIYKAPRSMDGEWQLVTRQPVPWWWIPASEHPGESEQKRGWEIMSAIEQFIIDNRSDDGLITLKDETGKTLSLEYIGLHQPVRRLSGGGKYFACSDFRKAGSDDEYYDIDFWLDDENGEIRVGDVRVHKIPEKIDGNWVQVPKYNFDDMTHEIVP